MRWLEKIREHDKRLDEEYQAQTTTESKTSSRNYCIGLVSVYFICGIVFVAISGIWITFWLPFIYGVVFLLIYRKEIFGQNNNV